MPKPTIYNQVACDEDLARLSVCNTLFPASEAETLADTLIMKEELTSSALSEVEAQHQEPKPGWRPYTILRYILLNTYRRLFSTVLISNVVALMIVLAHGVSILALVNASAANLLACGLARQPLVVNLLYKSSCKISRSAPLRLRMMAAKIFHYGGVHSGAGVAACMWYIAFVGKLTAQHTTLNPLTTAVLVLAWLILALLCAIITAAHPAIRMKTHNTFEYTHRFSGWLAIALFWPLLITFASSQPQHTGKFLVRQPTFYILLVLTAAVIHPWALLRRVPIQPEELSTHAIRLHFNHRNISFGQGLSISHHPLRDWHSFAGFPDHYDSPTTSFSLLVSKAGDWTSNAISSPPSQIYVRGVPATGFGYVMCLFSSIVLVTTGSGIGPCLSYLGLPEDKRPRIRIIWQTRSPEETYGPRIIDLVKRLDPNPVIIDTSMEGKRLDMLPFVMRLHREEETEAIAVISNPKLTKELVYGLECRGVPAYGPIFDS